MRTFVEIAGMVCGVICLAIVVGWLAILGWNEQEKVGAARVVCIEAGGVFLSAPSMCTWSREVEK